MAHRLGARYDLTARTPWRTRYTNPFRASSPMSGFAYLLQNRLPPLPESVEWKLPTDIGVIVGTLCVQRFRRAVQPEQQGTTQHRGWVGARETSRLTGRRQGYDGHPGH